MAGVLLAAAWPAAAQFPPSITHQPADQTARAGDTVVLQVEATGDPTPKFLWRLNGELIPGADQSTLILRNVSATDGGAYNVVVFNSLGAIESAVARVRVAAPALPFADDYAARGVLSGLSDSGSGSNVGASRDANEPLHAGKPGGASVWVAWQAPQSGVATFSTDGSDFDTLLAVYVRTATSEFELVAADDDSAGYHTSLVTFNAEAGRTYNIAVDGYAGATGNIVLNWNLLVTTEKLPVILSQTPSSTLNLGELLDLEVVFASAAPVQVQWLFNGVEVPGATSPVLSLSGMQGAQVGQYRARLATGSLVTLTPEIDIQVNTEGLVDVAAQNKLADAAGSLLSGLVGTVADGLNGVGGVVDGAVDNLTSGGSLKLLGAKSSTGFKSYGVVRGYSGTQIFHTSPGKDADEPNHCGVPGGASSWFGYQAPETGILSLNTDGSDFDTVLAVYRDDGSGQGYASLVPVGCDNNSGQDGKDSALSVAVTGGVTYYVVVDGVYGVTGTVYLSYALNALPQISSVASQTISQDSRTAALSFTVSDRETPAGSLFVWGWSSNSSLVPSSGISFGGSGGNRTVTLTPAAGKSGTATITLAVADSGGATRTTTFTLTVTPSNRPPSAGTDYGYLSGSNRIYFYIPNLLANDTDPDGDTLSLIWNSSSSYYGGSVCRSGSYLIYTAPYSWSGSDYFYYRISDGKGGYAYGGVSIR